jgi:hypothetical protein
MWSVYAADDPNHPAKPNENAMPGLARTPAPGLDPVELVVDGEKFVVTRRAGSSGIYDFAWTSHPASYGFTIGSNADWHPDRAELAEQIRSFLSNIQHRPEDRLSARLIPDAGRLTGWASNGRPQGVPLGYGAVGHQMTVLA